MTFFLWCKININIHDYLIICDVYILETITNLNLKNNIIVKIDCFFLIFDISICMTLNDLKN